MKTFVTGGSGFVGKRLVERLARDGFDAEYGARPLQRHVRRTLEKELTRAILAGELADGATVCAAVGEDGTVGLRCLAPQSQRA